MEKLHLVYHTFETLELMGWRKRAHEGGLSVGCRLEILRNVWRRLGNKTASVGLKWSVKCQATNSECRLILG